MLEAWCHEKCSFVTLTYRDAPVGPARGNLSPRDVQLFLKRLRKAVWPLEIRYYLVGEYGERTARPHYHLALYGLGEEDSELIGRVWAKGFVCVLPLCQRTAQYVVGYVTKKFDASVLAGRVPVFARMSTHPRGLGAGVIPHLSSFLTTEVGSRSVSLEGDVPAVLRHGQKLWPLGRYLRGRLRLEHGADKAELPEGKGAEWRAKMFAVRRLAGNRWRHRSVFMESTAGIEAREAFQKVRWL